MLRGKVDSDAARHAAEDIAKQPDVAEATDEGVWATPGSYKRDSRTRSDRAVAGLLGGQV